jgi:hypothetical protein
MPEIYAHGIFLRFPLPPRGPFQIPVPPETITGGTDQIMAAVPLIAVGEVLRKGGRRLEKIRWESHFPRIFDESIEVVNADGHLLPSQWTKMFENVQNNQTSVRVCIAGTPVDMDAAIASFHWGIVPGPEGDVWYQIELIEDKTGVIREFNGVDFASVDVRPRPGGFLPTTYQVRPGETLLDISIILYGTTDNWEALLAANIGIIYSGNASFAEAAPRGRIDVPPDTPPSFFGLWNEADPLPTGMLLKVPEITIANR